MTAKTLFEKVWEQHEVVPETADTPAVLYIDLHLVHEVTSPQAFSLLREQGLKVRRLDRTLATMDHSTPTDPEEIAGRVPIRVASAAVQIKQLEVNCKELGVELLGLSSGDRGVPGMEQGNRRDPYDVLLVQRSGKTSVYAHHGN